MLYKRTLVKGITWEVSGIVTLTLINYFVFGKAEISFGVAIVYGVLRIFMYYLHERIWKRVKWYKPKD